MALSCDGDHVLRVILSKAILLAADSKITDAATLGQLNAADAKAQSGATCPRSQWPVAHPAVQKGAELRPLGPDAQGDGRITGPRAD